jgi:hypothetical protein
LNGPCFSGNNLATGPKSRKPATGLIAGFQAPKRLIW